MIDSSWFDIGQKDDDLSSTKDDQGFLKMAAWLYRIKWRSFGKRQYVI